MSAASTANRVIIVPPRTLELQRRAYDPEASAWVSANAGSGKTTVLVRRVLRLMLSGAAPERILCLTYTAAAAATMADKLFGALRAWVRLDDERLDAALVELLDRQPAPAERIRARQLFAEALETPGGLKIQTIHAFCTRVLQSAPFEAGIPAHFEVISATDKAAAIEAAVTRTLMKASDDADALKASLDRIALAVDDRRFRELIDRALAASDSLIAPDGAVRATDEIKADLAAALRVDPSWTREGLERQGLAAIEAAMDFRDALAAVLSFGSPTEKAKWSALATDRERSPDVSSRLDVWRGVLCRSDGQLLAKAFTKPVLAGAPAIAARVELASEAYLAFRERVNAFTIYDLSASLFGLARLILADYDAAKRRMAALDFGDLIAATRRLFDSTRAAWLLYKLDAGLDHLLVDEAQDTSRDQWSILNALTGEFLSGLGQRNPGLMRTIFAVGDEKQSIYGFQGAAPAEFGRQRGELKRAHDQMERPFRDVPLTVSFRSTRDVIRAVDAVFAQPAAFKGLSHDPAATGTVHETIHGDLCGAVDLWDLIEPDPEEDELVWRRPVDAPDRQAPILTLARTIAATIRRWMDDGVDDLGRAFRPSDALVLMPRRKAAFGAIVRALKEAGVPVAGMDRLKLATHIAVQDLVALGRAALLPDDDLTLAVVLKSPLVGLDDDDLLRLAPGRRGSLRAALAESGHERDRKAEALLARIEPMATHLGPFAFYNRILSEMGGRKAMLGRLGAEAADAIDAFLVRALEHEQRDGPSLACFLSAVEASSDDVKRDLAVAAGEVRVMTVHGAKGLEAATVFIADIGMPPAGQLQGPLMQVPLPGANSARSVTVWAPRTADDCAASAEARNQVREQASEEHHRQLYVAMTRAENRLILCGVRPGKGSIAESWYGLVESGLAASPEGLAAIEPLPNGIGRRRFKVTPPLPARPPAEAAGAGAPDPRPPAALPEWVLAPAPPEASTEPPLAPAHALAAADRADREADQPGRLALMAAAAERGRFVHLLLQWLPAADPAHRRAVALRLGARHLPGASAAERERLIDQTLAVMSSHEARGLFADGSLAEVEIGGEIVTASGPRSVSGRIDRLMVREDHVVLADFKTSQRPPRDSTQIGARTLAQLAAYRALLRALYPGRPIRVLAIYTAGPLVLEPTPGQLDEALAALTEL
jgi:ATP-dependent helicase/nuclease subunit A